jgi:hypothetical protein
MDDRAILKHTCTAAAVNVAGEVPISRLAALCAQALGMATDARYRARCRDRRVEAPAGLA